MSRTSTIIALGPRRADLDAGLHRGESDVSLSKQFGVSVHAISRYKFRGTPVASTAAPKNPGVAKKMSKTPIQPSGATPDSLEPLQELEQLYRTGEALLKESQESFQFGASVAAVGRLTRILEIVGKMKGDLNTGGTVINNTTVTINEVSNEVQQVALNFADAPPEVRAWAAQNMLNTSSGEAA